MDVARRHRPVRPRVVVLALALVLCAPTAADAAGSTTRRVNLTSEGKQVAPPISGFYAYEPTLSQNGRYVSFVDWAALVPGDTNGRPDAYVRDRRTGVTERVSVSSSELQTTARTMEAAISSDGRYVVFSLTARFDEPPPPPGGIGPAGVYVRDRVAGTTHRVADGGLNVAISGDGRTVGFSTPASLVPRDTNEDWDAYVADWQSGRLQRVSVSSAERQTSGGTDNQISLDADGSLVAFDSGAPDLVAGDTNAVKDVFLRDRRAGTTTRISVSGGEAQADGASGLPSMSANGRYIAFQSFASDLRPGGTSGPQIWLRDRTAGTTTLVTVDGTGAPAAGVVGGGALSADGRHVAFSSESGNLVAGDTNGVQDVFVRDMAARSTTRVSVSTRGAQADGVSRETAISAHGAHIAFTSEASNLVPHDTNASFDVFIRNLGR